MELYFEEDIETLEDLDETDEETELKEAEREELGKKILGRVEKED